MRVSKERTVPDHLVLEAARYAGHDEVPDRVLQLAAMTDLENMWHILRIAPGAGLGEAHVADAAGHFAELLPGDLGIGLPRGDVVVGEKSVQVGGIDRLPTDEVHAGVANDIHPERIATCRLA